MPNNWNREWLEFECLQFVNNLFMSLEHDERVDYSLRRIFTEITGKLLFFAECTHGMHLLAKADCRDSAGTVRGLEMSWLHVDERTRAYLSGALRARNRLAGRPDVAEDALPQYVRVTEERRESANCLQQGLLRLSSQFVPFWPTVMQTSRWSVLIDWVNETVRRRASAGLHGVDAIALRAPELLVLPLSACTRQLAMGALGVVLLWRGERGIGKEMPEERIGQLKAAASTMGTRAAQFLKNHHGVTEHTYLPSHRVPSAERWVAVMFADIRGFTPATEILRNFNLSDALRTFMLEYHERMGQIIQKTGGRVHGLAGDGIMALFGESALDAHSRVEPALRAARGMCRAFDDLKAEFFGRRELRQFFEKEYEPLEMRLGVGINYGPVIFDYFGARGSRVYAPLGDHVNFAQRLEAEAHRFDSRLGRTRAPILLSRPAWTAVGAERNVPVVTLQFKGKPYEYQAYEYESQ
ncbi:MAG: adenylate/guanylate cyclase domain-containing protein [Phycisphaerae bacterium]|jgi:class 3 adenylate cyclase